jgi:hypothetical protein
VRANLFETGPSRRCFGGGARRKKAPIRLKICQNRKVFFVLKTLAETATSRPAALREKEDTAEWHRFGSQNCDSIATGGV